ncbi:low molecular weight protein arginine phosphatase [Sporosarcina sp. BI001-red]|uniref:low molecular weight protein arginine phosphatase n=1 Tax=Sporosarcina sp. BI001-red TaxID=2282866 RepID=UPI000E21C8EE|nr:low molecular weight protein arginine phosphatase [Sporosarcina sp. BI001-red]REB05905.1 low molecular weight protein arginine phosphatase [Sporosarcina sp. BI001-red]
MNICFICTGNTCRSPLAEGILKSKQLEGVSVRSAGLYATDGVLISNHSRYLLEKHGMPVTPTSRRFKDRDLAWADLILTMTVAHRDMLRIAVPNESNKILTLKEYVGAAEYDVQDPYGGNPEVYQQTFEELSDQIDVLARKLMGEQK